MAFELIEWDATFRPGYGHKWPFKELKVGQGFEVHKPGFRHSARGCANRYGERHGVKFQFVKEFDGRFYIVRIE